MLWLIEGDARRNLRDGACLAALYWMAHQMVEDLVAGVAQLVGEYVRARTRRRPARAPVRPEGPDSGWQPVNQDGCCLVSVCTLREPADQPGTLDLAASIKSALTV